MDEFPVKMYPGPAAINFPTIVVVVTPGAGTHDILQLKAPGPRRLWIQMFGCENSVAYCDAARAVS